MRKILAILIATAGLAWGGECAAQTEPTTAPALQLPDAALRGDLLAVCDMDLVKGDKTAWANAWTVITGGTPSTRPLAADAPLPMPLDQVLGPIFAMGTERLVYAVSVENSGMVTAICFHLREGVSEDAARKWLRRALPNAKVEHEDQWLEARFSSNGGSLPPSTAPISPQAELVRETLSIGGDVPIRAVYLTSEPVKRQLIRGGPPPAEFRAMTNLYWNARYIYIGAMLGAHPQIDVRWAAADENEADAVIKEFQSLRERLKKPDNGSGVPAFFGPILDQAQPTREGNTARATLGPKELHSIFLTIVAATLNTRSPGEQEVRQQPVSPDWKPVDAATDAASAQMRLILSAIVEYDAEHQAMPTTLDDLVSAKLLPVPEVLHDPRTGKDNGFVYVKPAGTRLADISARDKTAILFEQKDGHADEDGLTGYADGHVRMGK
jgi:hypothetical protein